MSVTITAEMVKVLRERTGAGMMLCKNALVESNGNMEAAEEAIAKAGHRRAAKAADRVAAEGLICIASSKKHIAIIEINCETDFVGRDESFGVFCNAVAALALAHQCADIATLMTLPFGTHATLEQAREELIVRIGENIQIRRVSIVPVGDTEVAGHYVHRGRIGVIAVLTGGSDTLGKDIAMHVAASAPEFITAADIPAARVEKEREILMAQVENMDKPAEVLAKIIDGRLNKFLAELCLDGQPFIKNPDQTVGALLAAEKSKVRQIVRYVVGEGIEKKVGLSFAEEVLSQVRA